MPLPVTRDYRFELSDVAGAPLLTVLGGKLTTYRRLAEAALAKLAPYFPRMQPAWTASSPLPGGNLAKAVWQASSKTFVAATAASRQPSSAVSRAVTARWSTICSAARSPKAISAGRWAAGLSEREVVYQRDHEWARDPDDILWRRTKCGLHMTAEQRKAAADAIARLL